MYNSELVERFSRFSEEKLSLMIFGGLLMTADWLEKGKHLVSAKSANDADADAVG